MSFAVMLCEGLRELHHEVDHDSPRDDMSSSASRQDCVTETTPSALTVNTLDSAFVHHDLKPSNMLLFTGDKEGPVRLVLTDFGMTV